MVWDQPIHSFPREFLCRTEFQWRQTSESLFADALQKDSFLVICSAWILSYYPTRWIEFAENTKCSFWWRWLDVTYNVRNACYVLFGTVPNMFPIAARHLTWPINRLIFLVFFTFLSFVLWWIHLMYKSIATRIVALNCTLTQFLWSGSNGCE